VLHPAHSVAGHQNKHRRRWRSQARGTANTIAPQASRDRWPVVLFSAASYGIDIALGWSNR